jgi:hypothetical protein
MLESAAIAMGHLDDDEILIVGTIGKIKDSMVTTGYYFVPEINARKVPSPICNRSYNSAKPPLFILRPLSTANASRTIEDPIRIAPLLDLE